VTYGFYLSDQPGPDRQTLLLPEGGIAYLRVEVFKTNDLEKALHMMRPYPDEMVMNTHPIPRHSHNR
jgi:hypothetical protein